jgi:MFS family permease
MTLCVALLIASAFMPVSLLTPIARDLHATDGMAGQAISISGLFAVVTSLLITTFAARFDRRHVLMGLTAVMLLSLVVIALAPNFAILMIARALLGIFIGGFWSLATATVMRLVPARRYLPDLIKLVWDRKIEPGKVFDLVLPLERVAEGYRAMDERRAIKALLLPNGKGKESRD